MASRAGKTKPALSCAKIRATSMLGPGLMLSRVGDRRGSAGLARGGLNTRGPTDQRGVLHDRSRLADEIPLHHITALTRDEAELFLSFHALGENRHMMAMTMAQH